MGRTRVCYYEPESKRQSMELKYADSLAKEKFQAQRSRKKTMLTDFWDMKGPMTIDFLEKVAAVKSASYC